MIQDGKTHYQGWLKSDFFIKRAVAVFLYGLIGGLMIAVPIYIAFYTMIFFLIMRYWS